MSLDIIIGPMYSGKSSKLLSIVSRYKSLGSRVLVVKHRIDNRYGVTNVITHDGGAIPCIAVDDLGEIPVDLYDIIVVDEAQFFRNLIAFCEHAVDTHNKHVYLFGLDGDSNRRPFGEILQCIPLADRVERLTAFCKRCANGTPGLFSYRREGPADQQVMVGGSERYETLCRECYIRTF